MSVPKVQQIISGGKTSINYCIKEKKIEQGGHSYTITGSHFFLHETVISLKVPTSVSMTTGAAARNGILGILVGCSGTGNWRYCMQALGPFSRVLPGEEEGFMVC